MFPIAALRTSPCDQALTPPFVVCGKLPLDRPTYAHLTIISADQRLKDAEWRILNSVLASLQISQGQEGKPPRRSRIAAEGQEVRAALDRRSQQRFATCRGRRKASISAVDSGELITTPAVRRAGAVRRCRVFAIAQHAAFVDRVFCGFSFPAGKFFQLAPAGVLLKSGGQA
jgi:hypothetical protein